MFIQKGLLSSNEWPFTLNEENSIELLLDKILQNSSTAAAKFQGGGSYTKPLTKQAADEAMKETAHFDVARIVKNLQQPVCFELKNGEESTSLFKRLEDLNSGSKSELKNNINRVTFLSLLVSKHTYPREALLISYDCREWHTFLHTYQIPVFPWEYGVYIGIEETPNLIGMEFKGNLAEFIWTEKHTLQWAKAEGWTTLPMPLSNFIVLQAARDVCVGELLAPGSKQKLKSLSKSAFHYSNVHFIFGRSKSISDIHNQWFMQVVTTSRLYQSLNRLSTFTVFL
jgi:hypothetical protein